MILFPCFQWKFKWLYSYKLITPFTLSRKIIKKIQREKRHTLLPLSKAFSCHSLTIRQAFLRKSGMHNHPITMWGKIMNCPISLAVFKQVLKMEKIYSQIFFLESRDFELLCECLIDLRKLICLFETAWLR